MAREEIVSNASEQLILVDDHDREIGYQGKADCHTGKGVLHRAFSIFVFNEDNELLLQQRSLSKMLWPGYWSNTCCSHPRRGEDMADAVHRRLRDELGVGARELTLLLPEFSYRASDGVVEENELCPVYVCRLEGDPASAPDEVAEWVWWDWDAFLAAAEAPDSVLSPWARLQAPLLDTALHGLRRRRTA